MTQNAVKINFFGAFRKCGDYEMLPLSSACSVDGLKDLLIKHMSGKIDAQLIRDSAIACNDMIVGPDHKVQPNETVSILPPVCGG